MKAIQVVGSPAGYQLLDRLGEGAAGVVYKARQVSTGQLVAVKMLRLGQVAEGAARDRLVARFARETQLCAQLHHPHIVRLLDKGESDTGELFAVFEYVPGETLRDLLLREGALAAPQAGELMGQVLDALVAAHEQGIVHRDLKPLNIMVSRSGAQWHAKVLDFGIGTLSADLGQAEVRDLTLTTETLGTPRYSAPEQLRGEPPTVKSDLYAWGLILLECLTGAPAISGNTLAQIYHQHLSPAEVPMPPGLLRHPLGELLRRVLSKSPRERGADTRGLFARFRQINLHSLVGSLSEESPAGMAAGGMDATATRASGSAPAERRQITMLCFSLAIASIGEAPADQEAVEAREALLEDQLTQCQDTCLAYAAYPAGTLGHTRLMYFGYPQASDTAARRAARAALDLVGQVAQRSRRLEKRDAIRLEIRVALHTGIVVTRPGQVPAGLAAAVATRLEHLAAPGAIVASEGARRLLERHFTLEPAGLLLAAEDTRAAPAWLLMAEREGEVASSPRDWTVQRQLLGRGAEFTALQALWQRAGAASGGALMLVGEPGMGKSRLVQSLCDHVRDDKGRAWVLQCLPEQRNTALYPFLRWMSAQLQLDSAPDAQLAGQRLRGALEAQGLAVAEVAPILCSWLSLPPPEDLPPIPHAPLRQKQIVLDTLVTLLDKLAAGPALLVLEDVHWIDPTSRELVDRLLGAPGRLALLLTSRPDGDYRPQLEVLPLQGLGQAEAEALVRRMLGSQILGDSEIAQLAARADGNPLYLTELTRARIDQHQRPAEASGGALLPEIPSSLRDVLSQALDRLGPAKETAQLAAALGREFEQSLLIETALRDEAAVQSDLEQMFLADLVYRQRRVQGDSFSFRHALIRDAAYDSMTAPLREQTHARIAQVLEASDAQANAAQLALHYAGAGRYDRAVSYGTRAAGLALSRALQDEALGHAEAARAWIPRLPEGERMAAELDLNLIATQAQMSKYGWADPRVRAGAERSHELLAHLDDQERSGAAMWALAIFHHVAGDRPRVRQLAEQMVELSERADSPALMRAAYTLQGVSHWIDGRYREAAVSLERVLAAPRAMHDQDATQFGLDCRCWSMAALSNVRWFLDADEAAALAIAEAAVAEAEALEHMPTLGLALMHHAYLYQPRGDRSGTSGPCGRLLDLSRRFGLPAVEAYGAAVDCWVRADAVSMAHILGGLQAMGCQLGQTFLCSLAADIAAGTGQFDAAIEAADRGLAQAAQSGEHYFEAQLLLQKAGYVLAGCTQSSQGPAMALLEQAVSCAERSGMEHTRRRAAQQLQALSAVGPGPARAAGAD